VILDGRYATGSAMCSDTSDRTARSRTAGSHLARLGEQVVRQHADETADDVADPVDPRLAPVRPEAGELRGDERAGVAARVDRGAGPAARR
jgi:hypothetical protein